MKNEKYCEIIDPKDFFKFANESEEKRRKDINNELDRIFKEQEREEKREKRRKKLNKLK